MLLSTSRFSHFSRFFSLASLIERSRKWKSPGKNCRGSSEDPLLDHPDLIEGDKRKTGRKASGSGSFIVVSTKDDDQSLAKDQMETSPSVPPSNRHTVGVESNSSSPSPISGGAGGIDTVSLVFRFGDPEEGILLDAFDLIEEKISWGQREIKTALGWVKFRGKMRETLTLDVSLPGGVKLGITPQSRSVWIEGRLSAILSGDKEDRNLYPVDFLRVAALRAAADVADLFELREDLDPLPLFLGSTVSLRRLDVTSEISSPASYGLSLLRGFANLSFAGERPIEIWGKENRIETINLRERGKGKRKKIRFRIYDKGSESGSHRPGERIRFERQLRFQGKKQPLISSISPEDAREWWRQGYEPWIGKDLDRHGLKVLPFERAAEKILLMTEKGALDWQKAERHLGTIAICLMRGESWWKDLGHRDAGYRRFRELKDLGISVSPGSVEIDLGDALQVAEESIASSEASDLPDFKKRKKIEPEEWRKEAKRELLRVVKEREEAKKAAEDPKPEAA